MFKRFRKLLTSVPSITVVGLLVAYLVTGFWVVPALLKWQLEKQVAQRGHVLHIDAIRFDPLRLELEVDKLALSDAGGQAMFSFGHLALDLQWRSIIDGAWTFTDARLHAPQLRLELAPGGGHNFSDLLAQFASEPGAESDTGTALPRLRVAQLSLSGGRIEWLDKLLAQPLVTRINSLNVDLRGLSSLPAEATRYRVQLRTDANETLDAQGVFGLDPLLARGRLSLQHLQVPTIARGLSRWLTLQAPAGDLSLAAELDLALGAHGRLAGTVKRIDLDIAGLSLQAPGADAALLAAESIGLQNGQLDLAQRDLRFAGFWLRKGSIALALDRQGQGDWMRMLRVAPPADKPPAVAASAANGPDKDSVPAPTTVAESAAWRVAIDDTHVADLAFGFRDPSRSRQLSITALQLRAAPALSLTGGDVRVDLGKTGLQLAGLQLTDGASQVATPQAQIDMTQPSIRLTGGAIGGRIDAVQLSMAQGLSLRQGDNKLSLGATVLDSGRIELGAATQSDAMVVDKPRLQIATVSANQQARSAALEKLLLQGDRIRLAWAGPTPLQWDALALELAGLRLTDARQDTELGLGGLTLADPSLVLRQDDAGVTIGLRTPALRLRELRARQLQDSAGLAELQLGASKLDITARSAGAALDVTLASLRANGRQLVASRGAEAAELASLMAGSESLQLGLDDKGLRLAGTLASMALQGLVMRQGEDTVGLQDGALTIGALSATSTAVAGQPANTTARLDDTVLSLETLALTRAQGSHALAQLAGAKLTAASLAMVLSQAPPDLRGDGLALTLRAAALRDPALDAGKPVLELAQATVQGAAFSVPDRSLAMDDLVAQDLRADLWIDAQGNLNLVELLDRLSGAAQASETLAEPDSANLAATTPAPPAQPLVVADSAAPPAWRIAVKNLALQDASAQFADPRRSPPLAVAVDGIALQASALDTGTPAPMQVDLRASLRSGGTVQAGGAVYPNSGAADLQLTVDALVLAPAQSYLADYLELTLASGTASSQGRLLLGDGSGSAPRLRFDGGFSVDQMLLEENAPKRPFLSWRSVGTKDLALTLGPDRLDIGELQLQGLDGRLIIAQDQSINLTDVLKKREPGQPAGDTTPAEAATGTVAAAGEPAVFPVDIARVRLSDGVLDFADLSLRPQFGTRMHQLQGVITGLSTDPERVAKVQLDARVDKFGSAKIRGQASLLQPDRLTEIDMAFRNLEMTALSPYVAKFAGYEIASGKLSLDLQYKVRDSKLLGQNKVVLNQMALGKKVESPDSLNLPLDLALAVLKDSNGVIDIGLPVSGDLNDPKFDYGAVIGKAIGNLLGGIVTAPFRALAALFGGGSDAAIDTIDFDPGSDILAPPEQQKIETVARALMARPQLQLQVAPVYAPREDTPVLQSLAVRGEVARHMGLTLAPGEDPGPIDVANPRAARAVEATFSARYAPAVLELLKQRAMPRPDASAATGTTPLDASTSSVTASSTPPAPTRAASAAAPAAPDAVAIADGKTAPLPAPALPGAFYQTLLDRMIREQVVSGQDLNALAQRRADNIVAQLTTTDGVAAARVTLAEPREATGASDKLVPLKLQLEVAK